MEEKRQFKLTFLGGASSIGASCTLIQTKESRILIDCGTRFQTSNPLPDFSILTNTHIDAIFITHAHTDHTGALPVICEAFPNAPVFATPPTIELVKILLMDSLRIMNMADRESEIPLYSEIQAERAINNMVPLPFYQSKKINDIEVKIFPASHILGAAMLHLSTPAGNILFTGDYSVATQLTVPALTRPVMHTDLIITESTYGQRLHEDRMAAESRLISQVAEVVEKGGKVLIPAFAIGRAQEVLLILKNALRRQQLTSVPVYVDGMVRTVCDIYKRYDSYVNQSLSRQTRKEQHPFYMNGIEPVKDKDQRQKVITGGACVIVASSGMLTGGASAFYAQALAGDENNAILITGYQDEESPGRKLLDLAEGEGEKEIAISGKQVKVSCAFQKYGLSAHADRMQMIGLLESLHPKSVVLVHGDMDARNSLARGLTCKDIILAKEGDVIERGYPQRNIKNSLEGWAEAISIDKESAQKLLGPSTDKPIPSKQLAEAWFGKRVRGAILQQFIQQLELLNLVKRDDSNRQLLWINQAEYTPNELSLEKNLKEENPKGKLIEMCMKLRLNTPEFINRQEGAFHVVSLKLIYNGEELISSDYKAGTLKTAEHLASKEMLELLIKHQSIGEYREVSAESQMRLKLENPKSKLLEQTQKQHLFPPQFQFKLIDKGVLSKVDIFLPNNTSLQSSWYLASNQKISDQAACQDILQQWNSNKENDVALISPVNATEAGESTNQAPTSLPDAGLQLNLMKQKGYIEDFGMETLSQSGPSHCPVYLVRGWIQMPGDTIHKTKETECQSKKKGKKEILAQLVELLGQLIMD